jgi:RsiW-degrading membrane proteinase PrsW (M82 family)
MVDDQLPHSVQTSQASGIRPYSGQVQVQRMIIEPIAPSPAPKNLLLAKYSSPWKIIRRMSALSIVTAFIAQMVVLIPFGIALFNSTLALVGMVCGFPLIGIFIWMKRPKLVEVVMATPAEVGATMHALSGQRTLQTPVTTVVRRHIVRDSGAFDIPAPKNLWQVFSVTMVIAITLIITSMVADTSDSSTLLALNFLVVILLAIPLMLLGFSIPVFAWWSFSSKRLGLPTRGHEAEAVLTAGMLSTIPAICINSILFPILLASLGIIGDWSSMGLDDGNNLATFLALAVSAPVGEELCKAGAVILMARYIDSPRRGFQVGFTVGLGFAIVENLIYVAGSFIGGGLISFVFTTFIRGIGSIPGHAVWTGITGLTIGWALSRNQSLADSVRGALGESDEVDSSNQPTWSLIDKDTGIQVDSVGVNQGGIEALASDAVVRDSGVAVAGGGVAIASTSRITLYGNNQREIFAGRGFPLPQTVSSGLLLAMLGHAFWNGTSFLSLYIAEMMGLSEVGMTLVFLGWTTFLVTAILFIGINIIRTVATVPGPTTVD